MVVAFMNAVRTQNEPLDNPSLDLRPSEARRLILAQHRSLRELLEPAADLAARARAGHDDALASVPHLLREIRHRMLGHMALEERVLLPILADVDSWGPQRAAHLIADHKRQRDLFAFLVGHAASGERDALATALTELVRDVLVDMEEEERDLLTEDLLHDDLLNVQQCTG